MTNKDARRTRRDRAKLILAGVAVAGIGAAVTTAAWTDDVWFSAEASAADFDLQGRVAGTNDWLDLGVDASVEDDADDTVIAIPATSWLSGGAPVDLTSLVPGDTATVTLELCNAGSTDITLAAAVPQMTGTMFEGSAPATVTASTYTYETAAPLSPADPYVAGADCAGEEATFTATLTIPEEWPAGEYMGSEGDIAILVVGTAS
ncbi:hypothetical protein [Demequina sp. NBRC 110057]|uniref:hypothetical protein n=1 Tax=Demequina sp. NBRC 110057 TaxID=1570346 RepID=UPI000A05DBEF|nr:hypothetical protein [Demequina sp. NBRC 110057]